MCTRKCWAHQPLSEDTYRNDHVLTVGFVHGMPSARLLLLSGFLLRSKEYIGLNLSVVVWKALVGQEVQLSDLENVDVLLTRSMQDIRTIDQKGKKTTQFPSSCELYARLDLCQLSCSLAILLLYESPRTAWRER